MSIASDREPALEPEDLGRLFLERANAGDVEGIVALYEPEAVLASRRAPSRPAPTHCARPTRFSGGATAELARRQRDGTWLWVVDQPNVVG